MFTNEIMENLANSIFLIKKPKETENIKLPITVELLLHLIFRKGHGNGK